MPALRKKLIEVALPRDAINKAASREESIRHGHPSTLHLWWARCPLAATRAVLFAQLVNDPSAHPDLFPAEAAQEGDFDADTRWALAWFDHAGFAAGDYGVAEQLPKVKNTSIAGMVQSWPEIERLARETATAVAGRPQAELF